jgi:hypothetical protein
MVCRKMPRLIEQAAVIQAPGNKPKRIEGGALRACPPFHPARCIGTDKGFEQQRTGHS